MMKKFLVCLIIIIFIFEKIIILCVRNLDIKTIIYFFNHCTFFILNNLKN